MTGNRFRGALEFMELVETATVDCIRANLQIPKSELDLQLDDLEDAGMIIRDGEWVEVVTDSASD